MSLDSPDELEVPAAPAAPGHARHYGNSARKLQSAWASALTTTWPRRIALGVGAVMAGILVLVLSFLGTTVLIDTLWPTALQQGRPVLTAMPPLRPLTRTSTVLAPAAITMGAIRDALEAQAPRNLAGKRQNPVPLLPNADINWTIARGPLNVSGRPDALVVATPLSGTFQAKGTITSAANAVTGVVGNIIGSIGGGVGQQVGNLVGKAFDQHAEIRGTVTATSRPTIAPNWRLAPNLSAQINVADVSLPIAAGIKLSVANEVKPFLDNAVREQTSALEARLRNDPFIEQAARSQWGKLCRAISLGAAGGEGMPNLWLEIRPTRAVAAQPKVSSEAMTLLVGVQAETRIVPNETKPNCPFPQQLELVEHANEGTIDIGVPIDMPFTEVNRLIEAQVKGRTFPEDGSGAFATTIKQAAIAASGDRLLISLVVTVKKRGFFSIGADATVHVWGRPVLDQERQIIRFTDIALDVQSKAAFGLLGEAAQAAVPYLQKTLADRAVIDLKPFAEDAKKRIAAAVGDFTTQASGLTANVAITDLRLVGIDYDDRTLRVIADADGTVNVTISSLSLQ